MSEIRSSGIFLCITILALITLLPLFARAEGQVVVFFSGLCLDQAYTCRASQQAYDALKPRLPAGTRIITPDLVGGRFRSQGDINSAVSSLGSDKIFFLAYSAGNQGLSQMVNAMDSGALQRVKSIVSLEAEYSGLTSAVNRVKSVNPNVDVRYIRSGQFNTNHAQLPGNVGVANSIASLVGGNPSDLPVTASNDPNRPLAQQLAQQPPPNYPPLISNMPASTQAPLNSAFSSAQPQTIPNTPSITPVSQVLVIPEIKQEIPSPVLTNSLVKDTKVVAPKLNTALGSATTKAPTQNPTPSTFTSGPMTTTWSAPLAVFDVRQEMSRALAGLENFLKGLLRQI